MFHAKASKEHLDVAKSLMACKPKPGAFICAFVLEMKGYFDRLKSLNMVFGVELSININLSGLPADYNQFVLSYQMDRKENSIMELHSLLQTAKQGIQKIDVPSTLAALMLSFGNNAKKRKTSHSNWKGKAAKGKSDRSYPKYMKDLNDEKVKKGSHSGSCESDEGLLDLVHTDVCGPFRSATKDGNHYYVTFTDDFSRYGYVYLIKHKSDTFEVFKRYRNKVENQIESTDEEPIVNTDTQQKGVTHVKPDDISLPIRKTSGRVSKPHQFYYGFHMEEDKISNSTLSELDKAANYKEAMASPEAATLKTVGCKWIFKKNTDMDGKVHTYKARSKDEPCIYVKVSGSVVVFLVLYVDNIVLIGNDIPMLQSVKDWLGKCFAMKDLGDASYILGIKIYRELDIMSGVPYASVVGSIMYVMTCTRPDISFALSMGAVTWKILKQDTMTDSTCEFEYISACEASKEAIWMKNFIRDIGVVPTLQDPIEIFCDNESVVALTKEHKDHKKSKHIERKYHFVQSNVEKGHVIVKHIQSKDNLTDPFTKALAKSRHKEHARNI
nr:hypothetical protein [Tanacetum cinerariifolium]